MPVPHVRGTDRRAIVGWALYDFANSAYTTLIVTFIYSSFFINYLVLDPVTGTPDAIAGTGLWGRAGSIGAITVALLSPFLGALADRSGKRKRFLLFTTVLTVLGASLLWLPTPGHAMLALTIFVLSNIAYELCSVLYNSYLPDVAPPDRIGRISGYGWSLGYLGGLSAMAIALFVFVQPEPPLFGLDGDTFEHVRITGPLVAVWFAVFSIPFFLWVRDVRPPVKDDEPLLAGTVRRLGSTFRDLRRYRQIVRLLVARLVYNDGLTAIFAFGGPYAMATFGFSLTEVLYFGVLLNVTAGLGAFTMGFLDDRIGGRRTVLITLVGLTLTTAAAAAVQTKAGLWVVGFAIGLFVGPNQAASRSLLGRFVPHEKEAEFFGFFAFSGKAIGFLGFLLFGTATELFGTQRAGVITIVLFFVVGGLLLLRVDEADGLRRGETGTAGD